MRLRDKSAESLTVARWCRDNGHYNRAVSAAYYAAYQALSHELDEVGAPYDASGVTGGLRWEHGTLPRGAVEYLGLPMSIADRLLTAYSDRVDADYYAIEMTSRDVDRMIELVLEVKRWISSNQTG